MFTIFKKELFGYFTNYTVYVSAIAFTVICALFLWYFDNDFNIFNTGNASLSSFFFIAPWAFLFLIPATTMRTFAGEENTGTLQWLFTQPIKIQNIVVGKYLAGIITVLFFMIFTLIYIYTLNQIKLNSDSLDFGVISSGYLGLFFLGCGFCAIGLFCSSLTSNPVLAYVSSIFICFLFFYGFQSLASYNLFGTYDYYVQRIGFQSHFQSFLKGIIDTRSIVYFIVMITLFLLLSGLNVIKKKSL